MVAALLGFAVAAASPQPSWPPSQKLPIDVAGSRAALEVRVLDAWRLGSARLDGTPDLSLRCDGAPLGAGSTAAITVRGDHVEVTIAEATRSCRRVDASAGDAVAVRADRRARRFRGSLALWASDRRLSIANAVALEPYVAAVVAAESGPAGPEALRALAVVARTFALRGGGRHRGGRLCDLAHCQVYGDLPSKAAVEAAAATTGRVLRRGGRLAAAYFHAACGGSTASAAEVFGEPPAVSTPGVADVGPDGRPRCADAFGVWTLTVGADELARVLGGPGPGPVRVARTFGSGHVARFEVAGHALSGEKMRSRMGRAFGWGRFPGTRFTVAVEGDRVTFTGRGAGHGVGLCQVGARAMESAGADWRAILAHDFPGAEVATDDGAP